MPSRLGGFTSESKKCTMKTDEAQEVLKVTIALIYSQTLNHTAPTLNHALSTLLSQREGWVEALEWLWKVWSISSTTRNSGMGIYTHPTQTTR